MAEKRGHMSNGYTDTDSKKPKTNDTATNNRQAIVEQAKARAAAKARELETKRAASQSTSSSAQSQQPEPKQNGVSTDKLAELKARAAAATNKASQAGTTQQDGAGAGGDKIAELRARMAAASNKAKAATAMKTDALPPQRPPAQSQSPAPPPAQEDEVAPTPSGRGGLHTKLHPMLMGDFGQDAGRGNKSRLPGSRHPTTQGNKRAPSPTAKAKQLDLSAPSLDELKKDNPYFDSSLSGKGAVPHERRSRALAFNMKGKYIMQAEALRKQAQLEEFKARIAAEQRKKAMQEDRSEQAFLVKNVPEVEWWDEGLIHGEAYPDFDNEPVIAQARIKLEGEDSIITDLIQHPILLDPPSDALKTEAKPMYLTKRETKKLRRQKRLTDLKEKQAKIRLGLQPPDPPKVKKQNLMRVLGEQAVKDPTAVEARVTREIEQRRETHEAANQERALSKEERQEKNASKAANDAAKGLFQTVYRIDSLAYGKNRSKIDMNAKQYKDLTGIMVTNPNACCVVVEGGTHTTKAMKKLLLQRIKWDENAPSTAMNVDPQGNTKSAPPAWLQPEGEDGQLKDLSGNRCVLVWEGEVRTRSFKFWAQRDCETDGAARQTMEKNKLENAWMAARNYDGGGA